MDVADEHFKLLVNAMEDRAVFLLDPAGRIQSWNKGAELLQGYARAEIVGQHYERLFTESDRAAAKPRTLLATALASGKVEAIGWRVRKDGFQYWARATITSIYDGDGAHIGFTTVTRDLSELNYRDFVEATNAIFWTTDAKGRPNADSPSWREFTGQTLEEWLGAQGFTPVHPLDAAALRIEWTAAKDEARTFQAQFRLRHRDGNYVWMETRGTPLLEAAGSVREWFGVTFDISARKAGELATQRTLDLWTTTLRSIGDAVISTDSRGCVGFLNAVAERLTGWSNDEARGRPLLDVFAIFDETTGLPARNPVDTVLAQGVVVGLASHTVLRGRDGREVPIDDSAAPILDADGTIQGVVLVFRDVSEQKLELTRAAFLSRATEELVGAVDYRAALTRIAELAVPRLADWAAVEISVEGSATTKQLAVAHIDPAKVTFARELGERYPPDPDAATGVPNVMRTGRSEFYPELPSAVLEANARGAEHLEILRALDLRSAIIVPLQGKTRVFGAITFVFAGSERRYTRRDLALAEELASRAALIIERRRLEEEAEHANRMKDEFLATISHELRTPLQAIVGYASMLEQGIAYDPPKAIATILRNAMAQTRLVDDILDVSRIASGKLRLAISRVDVAQPIRAALESTRPAAAARKIELVEIIPPSLGFVNGDFDRLQQVVWNLIANAVKFTPIGGTVEVTGRALGSHVEIRIRDTGKGIPGDHLLSIFERFRQVDGAITRSQGGLGLGLAIVRYLVEAHGGHVLATSEGVGQGSTFTVTLPLLVEAVLMPGAEQPSSKASQPLRDVRLLIVDDDPDARDLLVEVLQQAGAVVRSAGSAREAFELLAHTPPEVLLSDIGMPEEDGYSLVRRIRELPPHRGGDVPAIALTAYTRAEDIAAARAAGFQLHVVKPVSPDRLIASIRSIRRG